MTNSKIRCFYELSDFDSRYFSYQQKRNLVFPWSFQHHHQNLHLSSLDLIVAIDRACSSMHHWQRHQDELFPVSSVDKRAREQFYRLGLDTSPFDWTCSIYNDLNVELLKNRQTKRRVDCNVCSTTKFHRQKVYFRSLVTNS